MFVVLHQALSSVFVVDYTMTYEVVKNVVTQMQQGVEAALFAKLQPNVVMNEMVNQLGITAGLLQVNGKTVAKLPKKEIKTRFKPLFGKY